MDIGISFEAGIPVLTLTGRFDGSGAVEFDDQISTLDTTVVEWVIDMSGVAYLSSLGIRSLLSLDKRLKARDGGVVLAGVTPLVQKVLHVSRLEPFLRFAPTAAAAIETARASAAGAPTVELTLHRCRGRVRRVPGAASTIEWWRPAPAVVSGDPLLVVNVSDLGIAFGLGVLGGGAGAAGVPGPFVCTPQFAGMLDVQAGVTDLVVGDASQVVPIAVSAALGVVGAPVAVVELEDSSGFSLFDAVDDLFDGVVSSPAPPVLGFVALAQTPGHVPGVWHVAGVVLDPSAAASTIDPETRLDAMPGQLRLASGRHVVGAAVTLEASPRFDALPEIHDALRRDAALEMPGGITGFAECAPVTKTLVWVFASRELRNGIDKLLQVTVDGGGEWRPEWDAIVRRLYNDCRSVTLTPLPGGFMSSTFKAVAHDRDGRRTLPSVVKIGPTTLTRREQQANHDYVSRFILNNGTSVLGDAQEGEWAGLRYNFLGANGPDTRLVWLYDQYLQRPMPAVTALFERLVTRVLKPWYAQPKWEQVFLFRDHTPLRLFPDAHRDGRAASRDLGGRSRFRLWRARRPPSESVPVSQVPVPEARTRVAVVVHGCVPR